MKNQKIRKLIETLNEQGMIRSCSRPIDASGRIVIPKEYRDIFHMEAGDTCEFMVLEDDNFYNIVIRCEKKIYEIVE